MQKILYLIILSCSILYSTVIKAQSKDSIQADKQVTLNEVLVKADKPLIKVKNGIMTYSPRYLMENKIVKNAFDLLKEVSLITSPDEKTLNVIGASKTTIFISGKKSSLDMEGLADYLKMLPVEDVDKIEIIKNPTPKWNTNGAVVNIVLKRDRRILNGEIKGSLINQHDNSYNLSGSLRTSTKRYQMDMVYSFTRTNSKDHNTMNGIHTLSDNVYNISTATDENSKINTNRVFANFGYNIT